MLSIDCRRTSTDRRFDMEAVYKYVSFAIINHKILTIIGNITKIYRPTYSKPYKNKEFFYIYVHIDTTKNILDGNKNTILRK